MVNVRISLLLLFLTLMAAACSRPPEPTEPATIVAAERQPTSTAVPTATASATITPTPAITPTPTITPGPPLTATAPVPTTATVFYDGSGDYESLEAAIEAVAPESTIFLGAGTYHLERPLNIDKPLTLEARSRGTTIVVGEGPEYVVHYEGEGLFVTRGITFRREGDYAADVMVISAGEVDFSDCRVTGGAANEDGSITGSGLIFGSESGGVVSNCEIDLNAAFGILVGGQAKTELVGNDIHDNDGRGIYFRIDEDGGAVTQNRLRGNDIVFGNDITNYGPFAPMLDGNICSHEGPVLPNSEMGDQSGIVLWSVSSEDELPAATHVGTNDCAIAWCTGNPFNMTCQSSR